MALYHRILFFVFLFSSYMIVNSEFIDSSWNIYEYFGGSGFSTFTKETNQMVLAGLFNVINKPKKNDDVQFIKQLLQSSELSKPNSFQPGYPPGVIPIMPVDFPKSQKQCNLPGDLMPTAIADNKMVMLNNAKLLMILIPVIENYWPEPPIYDVRWKEQTKTFTILLINPVDCSFEKLTDSINVKYNLDAIVPRKNTFELIFREGSYINPLCVDVRTYTNTGLKIDALTKAVYNQDNLYNTGHLIPFNDHSIMQGYYYIDDFEWHKDILRTWSPDFEELDSYPISYSQDIYGCSFDHGIFSFCDHTSDGLNCYISNSIYDSYKIFFEIFFSNDIKHLVVRNLPNGKILIVYLEYFDEFSVFECFCINVIFVNKSGEIERKVTMSCPDEHEVTHLDAFVVNYSTVCVIALISKDSFGGIAMKCFD